MSSLPRYDLQETDQVFFLHIPKTAGTSLGNILDDHFDLQECFYRPALHNGYPRSADLQDIPDAKQIQYRFFRGHIYFDVMKQFLKKTPVCITMLRKPVARCISVFWHVRARSNNPLHVLANRLSLSEFIKHPDVASSIYNLQTRYVGYEFPSTLFESRSAFQTALKAQDDQAIKSSRVWLDAAKDLLPQMAFIGLTERYKESLALLAYTFGWRPYQEITFSNVTPNKPKQEELPPETVELLKEINTLDSELYQCGAELFEERLRQMTRDLVECYGDASHREIGYPLPDGILYELLERNYQQRSGGLGPAKRQVAYTFDLPLQGSGWHPRQETEHGVLRWTGPGTVSSIDFNVVPDQDYRIEFRITMSVASDILDSLSMKVNGETVKLSREFDRGKVAWFRGRIPLSALAKEKGLCRLQFEVSRTESVKQERRVKAEPHMLGLRFHWIKLSPAGPKWRDVVEDIVRLGVNFIRNQRRALQVIARRLRNNHEAQH